MKIIIFICLAIAGCSHAPVRPPPATPLAVVIQNYVDASKREDPFEAPYFNDEAHLGEFGDYPSPTFFARSKALLEKSLAELAPIPFAQLSETEKIDYRLFKDSLTDALESFNFPQGEAQFNQMGNRLHEFLDSSDPVMTRFPFDSLKHYRDYLRRADGFPAYVDNQIAVLREGIRTGVVLSCDVAGKVPSTYLPALESAAEKNPFYRPVLAPKVDLTVGDLEALRGQFRTLISAKLVPAYQKFDGFYRGEYLKSCRRGFGLASLPHGADWYRHQIKLWTGLDLTAEEVHQIGLNEVARISDEIRKLPGFSGKLGAFLRRKSTDPRSFFKSVPDLFAAFSKTKTEIAAKVPAEFSLIPKVDFKIVESTNPNDASGSYMEPTEFTPYGRFVVNTSNLRSVPIFGMTTLLMHEAVPGHHFQIALQYEMQNQLSEFRRKIFFSGAFCEGWALYAEYLGREMGMYGDPDQRFGNLNAEMWRAVRMVVDSGIHAKGWTKKRAMDYMRDHLAMDEKDRSNELDRYAVWPGQAVSYKVGQLKILELRRKAEAALGSKFDIRGFHAAVIGAGGISLGVLETRVDDWILQRRGS